MMKNALLLLLIMPVLMLAQDTKKEYGVYEYVIASAAVELNAAVASIESTATSSGWHFLANIHSGTPQGCPYHSLVLVLADSAYSREIMNANPKTGPFAAVDRVNVFDDENGVHVAVVNLHSITRTVLMDDLKYEPLAESHLQKLRALIIRAVPGNVSDKQFGEMREQGYINRTMGVMAGGKFEDKLEEEAVVPGSDWKSVAANVRKGLSKIGPQWGMQMVYEYELPEFRTVVFGSTGSPMDSRSFEIVKAGSDDTREKLKFAGLAHAAAYPIEIAVVQEGSSVKVRQVNGMFRMKMYFEDAGKWAFMKNMGMPGSIQDELKTQILAGLNIHK